MRKKFGPLSNRMVSVSIIIPAWNEAKILKATVRALLEINYDKKKCEVIIVAGGNDGTFEVAQGLSPIMDVFSRYFVILQPPSGKNEAIQIGIQEARNDMMVLLDADTLVSEQWLNRMTEPLQNGRADLTISNPEPVTKSWVSDYYSVVKAYSIDRITTYSGHSMAFKTEAVVGRLHHFFHKDVKVGVDYFLARQFLKEGRKVMFARDAIVTTYIPSSLKYFLLCELRWLSAWIKIDGVSYRRFASNAFVTVSLLFMLSFSRALFAFSFLFNTLYIAKKGRFFVVASRRHKTSALGFPGFVFLSYAHHMIGLIAYVRHFLGLSRTMHLYQGQR